jgi:hypothetical protein
MAVTGPFLVDDPHNEGGHILFLSLADMRELSKTGRKIWWSAFTRELPSPTTIEWVRDDKGPLT